MELACEYLQAFIGNCFHLPRPWTGTEGNAQSDFSSMHPLDESSSISPSSVGRWKQFPKPTNTHTLHRSQHLKLEQHRQVFGFRLAAVRRSSPNHTSLFAFNLVSTSPLVSSSHVQSHHLRWAIDIDQRILKPRGFIGSIVNSFTRQKGGHLV